MEVILPDSGIDLEAHLEDLRRRYMAEAMDRSHHVQTRAAEILGMTFRSFRYFAKKYGLTRGDPSGSPEAAGEELASATEDPAETSEDRHIRPRAV
jgi:hypothetical protein